MKGFLVHIHAGLNLSVFKAKSAYLCALFKSFSYKKFEK